MPVDGERFAEALKWAALRHAAQTRRGSDVPYITHLLAVASLVGENGGDEDTMIAAALHDAIEDQGGDDARQEIAALFGPRVGELVEACTDTDETPKPPWRARKEAHLQRLADPRRTSDEALLVQAADAVHNGRCVLAEVRAEGLAALDKFGGGRAGTAWRTQALADVLAARRPRCRLVAELAGLARELAAAVAGPAASGPRDVHPDVDVRRAAEMPDETRPFQPP